MARPLAELAGLPVLTLLSGLLWISAMGLFVAEHSGLLLRKWRVLQERTCLIGVSQTPALYTLRRMPQITNIAGRPRRASASRNPRPSGPDFRKRTLSHRGRRRGSTPDRSCHRWPNSRTTHARDARVRQTGILVREQASQVARRAAASSQDIQLYASSARAGAGASDPAFQLGPATELRLALIRAPDHRKPLRSPKG